MRILNANTLSAKGVLLDLISKTGTGHSPDTINTWLTFSLGTDLFGAWLVYDGDEPVGMITSEVVNADGPAVFIAFNYVKSGISINKELVQRVEDWAKEAGINKLLFYTKRSPRTFIKKYGFELVQSVLKKDI